MAVRLTSKWDMRRLAKSIGATVLPRLASPTPDEMGFCDDVKVKSHLSFRVKDGPEIGWATLLWLLLDGPE